MAAKIKEVAKRAGVSTATVSRILNGKGGHSAATVKSVERIIGDMGFSSGHYSSKPACVGLVMLACQDFLTNSYTATLVSSIMEMLAAEGMIAQIIPITPRRLSFQYIGEIVEAYSLKGLIILEFHQLYEVSKHLDRLEIPVVSIGNTEPPLKHTVCSDGYQAGNDAAAYFWSLGHRRFGILSMRQTDICQRLRLEGFTAFITKMGGYISSIWKKEYNCENDSLTSAVAEMVNMKQRPTAVFISNSKIALKFMIELRKSDIQVPEDVSLISVEERGELETLELPMTALCQPTRLMGETAVRILINLIQNRQTPEKQILSCNLVVRNTTAQVSAKS
jgi:LacI family transcriptional regulator